MDIRNQVLLSALLLPLMYFKIALSLLYSRLNSLMQSFLTGHVSFHSRNSHCFPLDFLQSTLLLLKVQCQHWTQFHC